MNSQNTIAYYDELISGTNNIVVGFSRDFSLTKFQRFYRECVGTFGKNIDCVPLAIIELIKGADSMISITCDIVLMLNNDEFMSKHDNMTIIQHICKYIRFEQPRDYITREIICKFLKKKPEIIADAICDMLLDPTCVYNVEDILNELNLFPNDALSLVSDALAKLKLKCNEVYDKNSLTLAKLVLMTYKCSILSADNEYLSVHNENLQNKIEEIKSVFKQ